MGLQTYYNEICSTGAWSHPNPQKCGCRGHGWWNSELDTWHFCPYHGEEEFPHPEYDDADNTVWEDTYRKVVNRYRAHPQAFVEARQAIIKAEHTHVAAWNKNFQHRVQQHIAKGCSQAHATYKEIRATLNAAAILLDDQMEQDEF